jgi:hypothetical protein
MVPKYNRRDDQTGDLFRFNACLADSLAVELDPSLGLRAYISPGAWSRGALKTKLVYLGDPALDREFWGLGWCGEGELQDSPRRRSWLEGMHLREMQGILTEKTKTGAPDANGWASHPEDGRSSEPGGC